MMATCGDLTRQPVPKDTDGLSNLPALTGGQPQVHEYFYWEFHEGGFQQALRAGNWKYVKPALYDLSQDLHETTDVAQQNPAVVARMEKILATVRTHSPDFPVR
jgi:arylsulfatase A-like enzyme